MTKLRDQFGARLVARSERAAQTKPVPLEGPPPESLPREPTSPAPESTAPREGRPREAPPQESTAEGYTPLANWILDDFLPRLDVQEQAVMLRLYRLTIGFNRDVCRVSHARLAEKTRLSKNSVIRATKRLVAAGYVEERLVTVRTSGGRALEYRVLPAALPPVLRKGPPRAAPPGEGRARESRMTGDSDKKDGQAPDKFALRTIAARLLERHRNEPGFDHARLRALLLDVLAASGVEPDARLVDEAIGGMLA